MGLDQFMYVAAPEQYSKFWTNAKRNPETGIVENSQVEKPREIAYRRKHPNLHGWMERLWIKKGSPSTLNKEEYLPFNGIELELTLNDIQQLEDDLLSGKVAELGTVGFFFGDSSDEYYKEEDLQFCVDAKREILAGNTVFYNSSW